MVWVTHIKQKIFIFHPVASFLKRSKHKLGPARVPSNVITHTKFETNRLIILTLLQWVENWPCLWWLLWRSPSWQTLILFSKSHNLCMKFVNWEYVWTLSGISSLDLESAVVIEIFWFWSRELRKAAMFLFCTLMQL